MGQGITLGAAQGFEEGPEQLRLAHLRDCSVLKRPHRRGKTGLKQSPLSPCLAAAQAKERAALLWSAIKEKVK